MLSKLFKNAAKMEFRKTIPVRTISVISNRINLLSHNKLTGKQFYPKINWMSGDQFENLCGLNGRLSKRMYMDENRMRGNRFSENSLDSWNEYMNKLAELARENDLFSDEAIQLLNSVLELYIYIYIYIVNHVRIKS